MSRIPSAARPLFVIILLVAASVVAGCLGSEETNPEFAAAGADGVLYEGWAYDGSGASPANASLSVNVDEPSNTGRIDVEGTWSDDQPFSISLTEFSHNEDDFHSGGVAANFVEHGDSGVGNALLPAMNLLIATWSTGQILFNGTALNDTYTGEDVWSMHLMVTDTGTRDDESGVVGDGAGGTYSPEAPGEADQGTDNEAILVISSTYANATRPDGNATLDGSVGARSSLDKTFEVESAGAAITIDVAIPGEPQEVGPYVFRLVDPDGINRDQLTLGPTAQATEGTLSANATQRGTYTLQVTSQTTEGPFTAQASITYPPKPVYLLHWEDVEIMETVSGAI